VKGDVQVIFSGWDRISASAANAPDETERAAVIHNQEKPGGDVR
jgi:hypothetical protein